MSDFLSRLAARSLGRATIVRPRLPGRFESPIGAPAATPVDLEVVEEAAAPVGDRGRSPPRDRPATPAQRKPAEVGAVPLSPLPRPAKPASLASRAAPVAPPVPVAVPAPSTPSAALPPGVPPVPLAPIVPSTVPVAARLEPLPTPAPPREPLRPAVRAVPPTAQAAPIVSPTRRELGRIEWIAPDKREDQRTTEPSADEPDVRIVAVSPPVTMVVPRQSAEQAEPLKALPPASPAAPTIRVTIGRIEVRAVSPPAPAEPRSAAAPALSLEEYLRRGGRP